MITVTKRDLIELGYGPSFAADIIKKAKELMVEKGHTYYPVSYTHLASICPISSTSSSASAIWIFFSR